MWRIDVFVRRYIDILILLIPTPLVSGIFAAASLLLVLNYKKKVFSSLYIIYIYIERILHSNMVSVGLAQVCPNYYYYYYY